MSKTKHSIRRYDALGLSYGEKIFTGSKRECLEYLKSTFSRNTLNVQAVRRNRNRFTVFKTLNTYQYHVEAV